MQADAIDAAAECHLRHGDRRAAVHDDTRLLLEHGDSDAAQRARLRFARNAAVLGEPSLAHILLQSLIEGVPQERAEKGGAGAASSSLRVRAEQLDALLWRVSRDRPDALGSRSFDPSFRGETPFREVTALAVDEGGEVWALEGGSGQILKLGGSEGGRAPAAGSERPRGMVLDRAGKVSVWDERGIVRPDGTRFEPLGPAGGGGEPSPVRRILGVTFLPSGDLVLLDGGGPRVLRYGADHATGELVASLESRPTGIAASDDGSLFVLLGSRREIVVLEPSASSRSGLAALRPPLALEGPDWRVDSPVAMAIDPLGGLYVLDAGTGTVTILNRKGARAARIVGERGTPGELRSPSAVAVDAAGRIYVADRRPGRVLRFQ